MQRVQLFLSSIKITVKTNHHINTHKLPIIIFARRNSGYWWLGDTRAILQTFCRGDKIPGRWDRIFKYFMHYSYCFVFCSFFCFFFLCSFINSIVIFCCFIKTVCIKFVRKVDKSHKVQICIYCLHVTASGYTETRTRGADLEFWQRVYATVFYEFTPQCYVLVEGFLCYSHFRCFSNLNFFYSPFLFSAVCSDYPWK